MTSVIIATFTTDDRDIITRYLSYRQMQINELTSCMINIDNYDVPIPIESMHNVAYGRQRQRHLPLRQSNNIDSTNSILCYNFPCFFLCYDYESHVIM